MRSAECYKQRGKCDSRWPHGTSRWLQRNMRSAHGVLQCRRCAEHRARRVSPWRRCAGHLPRGMSPWRRWDDPRTHLPLRRSGRGSPADRGAQQRGHERPDERFLRQRRHSSRLCRFRRSGECGNPNNRRSVGSAWLRSLIDWGGCTKRMSSTGDAADRSSVGSVPHALGFQAGDRFSGVSQVQ
jgi:hypothetical protein